MEITRWQRLRTRFYLFAVGVKRHMTLGARIVLIDGDKVLLVRHGYLPGWHFPGGGVEPGETAADCAAREAFEETGYQARGAVELFGLYHNTNPATNRDHVALYVCRQFEMVRQFEPSFEINELGWFSYSDLPEAIHAGTRRRLDEIFAAAPCTPNW